MPFACIHGWMAHRKKSFVPFFAVIFASAESPGAGPTKTESPGLSKLGGGSTPTPSSVHRCGGGAAPSTLGSTPCAVAIDWQIEHSFSCFVVRGRSLFLTMLNVCGP